MPRIAPGGGRCTVLAAFDIAQAIDLDIAERLVTDAKERVAVRHSRKAPPYFTYTPPPLRIVRTAPVIAAGAFRTNPTIELVIFDFGAVSVRFRIDFDGPASQLLDLSEAVFDNAAILSEAHKQVESLLGALASAVRTPRIDARLEDYIIFQVSQLEGGAPPSDLLARNPDYLAKVLRAERGEIAAEESLDALGCRLVYSPADAVLIDWNAAIVLDAEGDDALTVLEFANVELLELRFLDDRLDLQLEESYQALARQEGRRRWFILPPPVRDLARIGRLQVDSALLFENVNNALKLIGDQYLARLYRLAATRFHLPERDETIGRKLRTLESIYEKMSDYQAGVRADLLEWIIIILIAISIVLPFLGIGK
jgi:hypothetical protein